MNIVNKAINLVFIFLIILVLSACEETEHAEEDLNAKNDQPVEYVTPDNEPSNGDSNTENKLQDITYSFTNPKTGQEFAILHAYMLYDDYFEALEEYPDESPHQLFRQVISDPIYDACFKDAEYEKFSVFEWTPKESDFERMKNQIKSINKEQLNQFYEEPLIKSSDILPSDLKTTVCVFPNDQISPSDMSAAGAGKIFVNFRGIDLYSKPGISHEYHHSVWTEKHYKNNYFMTVLDYLIMEGEAVLFETFVYPDLNSAAYVIDETFNKEHWNIVETYLESGYSTEFAIGGYKDLPPNYGYSEGYKIIRSYLELHPNMTVEEWTSKSPKEIFEESNYMANYE